MAVIADNCGLLLDILTTGVIVDKKEKDCESSVSLRKTDSSGYENVIILVLARAIEKLSVMYHCTMTSPNEQAPGRNIYDHSFDEDPTEIILY